jgi:hypothetical protein
MLLPITDRGRAASPTASQRCHGRTVEDDRNRTKVFLEIARATEGKGARLEVPRGQVPLAVSIQFRSPAPGTQEGFDGVKAIVPVTGLIKPSISQSTW